MAQTYRYARMFFQHKGYEGPYLTLNNGAGVNWDPWNSWFNIDPEKRIPGFDPDSCPAVQKRETMKCTECQRNSVCPLFLVVCGLFSTIKSIEVHGETYVPF